MSMCDAQSIDNVSAPSISYKKKGYKQVSTKGVKIQYCTRNILNTSIKKYYE